MSDEAFQERLAQAVGQNYRIERELGRGGMAIVYLAEDVALNRPVALKVLKPDLAASLGGERFLKEIQLAARLNHPHILPLHHSGAADGRSKSGSICCCRISTLCVVRRGSMS